MVDMARTGFPKEMYRDAHPAQTGTLEGIAENVVETVSTYAREKPVPALFFAVGIGFFLGWRLKPW